MITECSADFGWRLTRSLYLVFAISNVLGCSSQVGETLLGEGALEEKTLFHQGLEREFLLYIPSAVSSAPPLGGCYAWLHRQYARHSELRWNE